MKSAEMRQWRAALRLTWDTAAERLGVHRSTIARYEAGDLPIPRSIGLAMSALAAGLDEYRAPLPQEATP